MLDYNLNVSEFEFQSGYYDHFRTNTFVKGSNLVIHRDMWWQVSKLFFYDFVIK